MAITISGSGITSANIADGTIVNADINSSAAIDGTKLTGIGGTGSAFFAYKNDGDQSIPHNTQTKMTVTTEEFDVNNEFSNSRFTPTVAGYYFISGSARLNVGTSSAEVFIAIWKNGSQFTRGSNWTGMSSVGDTGLDIANMMYFNGSTDYVEIYIYQSSGGARNARTGLPYSTFTGAFIRGV